MTAPTEGGPAPDFTAKDTDGKEIKLSALRGRNVVLMFTPGLGPVCDAQACAFRDAAAEFTDLDAVIIGISAMADGTDFKNQHSLPFSVISDGRGELQQLYSLSTFAWTFGMIPGRVTFIIDKEGILRKIYSNQVGTKAHVTAARDAIRFFAS